MCTVCGFCTNFLFRQIWSIGSKVMSNQSYVLKLCRSWPLCYESIRVASLNSRIFQVQDGVKSPLMSQITPRWILIRLCGVFWPIMPHSLVQNATKLKIQLAIGRCFTNKSHFFSLHTEKKFINRNWSKHMVIAQNFDFSHSGRRLTVLSRCPRSSKKCPRFSKSL